MISKVTPTEVVTGLIERQTHLHQNNLVDNAGSSSQILTPNAKERQQLSTFNGSYFDMRGTINTILASMASRDEDWCMWSLHMENFIKQPLSRCAYQQAIKREEILYDISLW